MTGVISTQSYVNPYHWSKQMGGGNKGKKSKKTKKKKTYTKAQQMAKKRIAAKKESTKTSTTNNKTKLTGQQKLASLGRAPKSVLGPTKAQQIAKARIASGKTISQVKAANTASMKAAAAKRNDAFKAKKAADAANRKLKAQGGTSAQVAKDNKQYGNTVPAGSFGISEAGKAQAAANLAARTVPAGSFGISEAGRKQAEANKAAAAAKKAAADKAAAAKAQAEAKSAAESRRLAAENARRIAAERAKAEAARKAEEKRQRQFSPERLRYQNKDYLTATPYVNAFKRTFGQDATLQGNRFNPADRAAALGAGYTDSAIGIANFAKNRLIPFGKLAPNIPTLPKFKDENLQKLRGFGSVVIPGLQTFGAAQRLSKVGLGQEISQMKLPNTGKYAFSDAPGAFRPRLTKTGIEGVSPVTIASAFTPKMLATGPTAGGSAAILGTATGLSAAQQAKTSDSQTGGLNIGGSAQASEGNTGRSLTSRALGAVDAVVGTDLDKLGGRTTPFGERLTSSIDSFGTLKKNMSDLGINMGGDLSLKGLQNRAKNISTTGKNLSMEDLAASTSFAKSFKDKPLDAVANLNPDGSRRVIKTLKTLDKNKDVSEALANYGGEGFQKGLRDTASLVSDNYDKLSTDAKGNRKVVSDMLMGNDPRSEFGKRLAFQQKENPQLSMQSKIKYASDPNFKQYTGTDRQGNKVFENKIKGINRKEMGIVGGLGNFVLSNQGRDVVTGNLPGTNNALDLASNIINTGRDPSSSTYKASQGFLKTLGAGGQPTPGSIIRGVNPFRGSNRGGGTTTAPRFQSVGGGGGTTTTTATPTATATPVPQFQVPEFPVQQGTDAGNLANIQNESYQSTFKNLMAINPNYSARFRMRRRGGGRRGSFKRSFSRRFFR